MFLTIYRFVFEQHNCTIKEEDKYKLIMPNAAVITFAKNIDAFKYINVFEKIDYSSVEHN